jgi:hypothetical protein
MQPEVPSSQKAAFFKTDFAIFVLDNRLTRL